MTRISRDALAFLSGVFLLCMSVLMIQIVQTRILSVVSLYYMAFFSISMAMLGLTGGALIVYYKLDHVNPGNVNAFLSRISTAFALCIAACFALELASPLPSVAWATYVVLWFKAIVLLAAPFTIGGIAVSLALTRSGFPIGITYGVDLLGAATGCLASLALLTWMDASSAMFMIAALAAVAAWCFGRAASEPVPAGSRPELAHSRQTGFRRRLPGSACRLECHDQFRPAAHRGQVRQARSAQQYLPHQVEFVFPHRCVDPHHGPSVSLGGLADGAGRRHARATRTDHRRDGRDVDASVLRRTRPPGFPALRRHQSRLLRPPQWALRRHRGRQRARYVVGPSVRVPRHYRRRAQSHLHRPPHGSGQAARLRRRRRPAGNALRGRRRPELVRADPGEIRPDRNEHGRYLGRHRCRRILALGERALHRRGLEDISLRAESERPAHCIPLALAALDGRARPRRQPGRRRLDGTRRRSSQRPHLRRGDRQSRHRHRVARAIRPIRPADTAGNRRQIALHRAREPGPARHGSGHRRHAYGAKPAGPECAGSAPLPRRVAADRLQAVLLQSASLYPPERHLLRAARMARGQDFSIRDPAGTATSSPSARFSWSFSCRPSWS